MPKLHKPGTSCYRVTVLGTPTEPGEEATYYIRVSSTLSNDPPSNVVEAKLHVCGNEVIKETESGTHVLSYIDFDQISKEEILYSEYSKWFAIDENSEALCGSDNTYQLV